MYAVTELLSMTTRLEPNVIVQAVALDVQHPSCACPALAHFDEQEQRGLAFTSERQG